MKKIIGIILALVIAFSVCGYAVITSATGESSMEKNVEEYISGGEQIIEEDIKGVFEKNKLDVICQVEVAEGTTKVSIKIAIKDVSIADDDKIEELKDILDLEDEKKEALKADFLFLKKECKDITGVNINFFTNDAIDETEKAINPDAEEQFLIGDPIVLVYE